MQITRQADYAIRAVRYLAKEYAKNPSANSTAAKENKDVKDRSSTREVASEMKIPPSFLAKIISQLSIAGLLNTSRGARGGVSLKRAPREISLLDVVEAIDGPILLNECVGDPDKCQFADDCPMHPIWMEAQEMLVKRLRETTFATLLK